MLIYLFENQFQGKLIGKSADLKMLLIGSRSRLYLALFGGWSEQRFEQMVFVCEALIKVTH